MTVVLEDQVKTITAELDGRFGYPTHVPGLPPTFCGNIEIEHVVRAVIAMYDISDIGREQRPSIGTVADLYSLWDGSLRASE